MKNYCILKANILYVFSFVCESSTCKNVGVCLNIVDILLDISFAVQTFQTVNSEHTNIDTHTFTLCSIFLKKKKFSQKRFAHIENLEIYFDVHLFVNCTMYCISFHIIINSF